MANRVLCKIRVRIKLLYTTQVLFILFYRGTGTKCYCQKRGLYKTLKYHSPIFFPEVHLVFFKCGKGLNKNVEQIPLPIQGPYKIYFHDPSSFSGSILNILYRGTGTTSYCRVGAFTKIQNFASPFPFWNSACFSSKVVNV